MPYTLLMFAGQCMSACDETNAPYAIMTDDPKDPEHGGVIVYDIYQHQTPSMDRVREMMSGLHSFVALATFVKWAPTPTGESSIAWCLVAVGRGEAARLAVRRIEEDEKWTLIDMSNAPWFAASTAGALRQWLQGDFSAPFREVPKDSRLLLDPVSQGNPPPTHPDGRI